MSSYLCLLDETGMLPRSVGFSLTEENYPSLARFRLPDIIEKPPTEVPSFVDTGRREAKRRVRKVLKERK